jgi:pre-mRNA-splicing helicase BRR2
MTYIQQSACRLMRAIFEVALKKGWAGLTLKVLNVCKMIETGSWGSQSPLRQFKSIPDIIIRKLEKNSDITWDRYFDLKANDLGEMVKIPKMGKTLFKFVHMFPKLLLNAHILPITRSLIKVDLSVTIDFEFDSQVHDSSMLFWVIVEDGDGENILHHEALVLKLGSNAEKSTVLNFTVQLYDPMPPQYFVKVVSDRWLHAETILPISFRHLILPQRFPLATELLDLQPLPVDSVANLNAKKLFSSFKYFNPIQTQTFNALYETDLNVLVCAPSGSGKTVCAELALLRLLTTNTDGKCVYVASKKVKSFLFSFLFFTSCIFRKLLNRFSQFGRPSLVKFLTLKW